MNSSQHSTVFKISAAILPASFALYLVSLTMNVALVRTQLKILGVAKTTDEPVKLLSTIETLYESGDLTLAIIITCFTIVFPIGKYLALGWVMLFDREPLRSRIHTGIKNLGQWSMGDVFVVALLVVIVRINNSVAELHVLPQPGLYVFTASVLTSMVVSVLLSYDQRREHTQRERTRIKVATVEAKPGATARGGAVFPELGKSE